MTVYIHELKQSLKTFFVWTGVIACFVAVCVFMFPEMKGQMDAVSEMFASMGSFTAAFGMDRLNLGEIMGFYGIECGNILGLGGAFFAALAGMSALSKEERDHTSDFLLTHPISRASVVTQKLLSVITQVLAMNVLILIVAVLSISAIGESVALKEMLLLHLAYTALQVEIAAICFGLSSFVRRGGLGIGLGTAVLLYFLNIVANIAQSADFLKYVTPYGFADAADILSKSAINGSYMLVGAAITAVSIASAYAVYCKKDIE